MTLKKFLEGTKWLIAATVFAGVLLAASHEQCCQHVSECCMHGAAFGFAVGLMMQAFAIREEGVNKAVEWSEVRHETEAALVIGLFTGLLESLPRLLEW